MRFVEGNFFQTLYRAYKRGYPIFRNVFKDYALNSLKDQQQVARSVRSGDFYKTPHEVVRALKLQDLIGKTTVEWLMEISGLGRDETLALPFVDDILGGGQVHNYNQVLTRTGALVSVVSAIRVLVDKSDIYIPRNSSTFTRRLLAETNVNIRCRTEVTIIDKRDDWRGYYLVTEETMEDGSIIKREEKFDQVFIARPLNIPRRLWIEVPGMQIEKEMEVPWELFQTSLIDGRLSGEYFNLTQKEMDKIGDIHSPSSKTTLFSSIGRVWRNSSASLYKIFSLADIPALELERMFLPHYTVVSRWQVRGQPEYKYGKTCKTNTPFELAQGLYYPNSLESCFATAEVAALSARNVVNLALNGGARSFNGVAEDVAVDEKVEL